MPRVWVQRDLDEALKQGCHHFPAVHLRGDVIINLTKLGISKLDKLCFAGAVFNGDLKIIGGEIGTLCMDGAAVEGHFDARKTVIATLDGDGLRAGQLSLSRTTLPREGRSVVHAQA